MPAHLSRLPGKSFANEPVHLQLAKICREAILAGAYAADERFPSERELAEQFDVSRATANKVLSTLVAEGLLEFQKGIGTRVRKRRTLFASLGGMESFTAHVERQGLKPSTIVLKFETQSSQALPEVVKQGLGLTDALPEKIIYLERLRLANEIPMILEHRWVRSKLAPDLGPNDVAESFYRVLEEQFGLCMTGERHSISAVVLNEEQTAAFAAEFPAPALLVEGVGFVKDQSPLWYQRLFYRGDHYELKNETTGLASSGVELRLTN